MINLTWREIRHVSIEDYVLYQALYDVYINYIGNKNDDIDKIIENIQDYIEDYIEELIKYASPYEYSVGNIDSENITDLVTGDEFLEKFKEWYLND